MLQQTYEAYLCSVRVAVFFEQGMQRLERHLLGVLRQPYLVQHYNRHNPEISGFELVL